MSLSGREGRLRGAHCIDWHTLCLLNFHVGWWRVVCRIPQQLHLVIPLSRSLAKDLAFLQTIERLICKFYQSVTTEDITKLNYFSGCMQTYGFLSYNTLCCLIKYTDTKSYYGNTWIMLLGLFSR